MQPSKSQSRSEFFGRLAYYLIGLSIGLVMLGLWQMERRTLMAKAQAEAAAAQSQAAQQQAKELGLQPPPQPPSTPQPGAPTK